MARKKKYDETEVLEKAMYAFWQRGYKGITTRELAEAMEINQFSLYASFESKENLFCRAIEHYQETIIEQGTFLPMNGEDVTLNDVRLFLEQFVGASEAGYPNGCLICKSMVDAFNMNDQVDAVIDRYKSLIVNAFRKALQNSFPEADEEFVHHKSEFLFGALLGLALQKRMGINGEPIQIYVDEMMNAIPWQGK